MGTENMVQGKRNTYVRRLANCSDSSPDLCCIEQLSKSLKTEWLLAVLL